MERLNSNRLYHDSDYDPETLYFKTKPRYNNSVIGGGGLNYAPSYHRRSAAGGGGAGGTSYMILCQEVKLGSVIGKSGSVIKAIERTGACVIVHELIPGDEERIIEIFDKQRPDLDGRVPEFYPAQEALFLIHDRIVEIDRRNVGFGDNVNKEFGPRDGGRNGDRVITRLVVSRMHVGSLLGKEGKIIQRMKIKTSTHITVLPIDHNLPRCVASSEEIVHVVGDKNSVKDAIAIISTRLRESQHQYGNHVHNRLNSPQVLFPNNDALIPHTNSSARRSSVEGSNLGSMFLAGSKSNITPSHSSGRAPLAHNVESFSGEGIVFQILCPADKVDGVVGESDGIVDLLRYKVGVDVKVAGSVVGADERIIIISSDEGLNDEMFPAQEALLHIQTRIVDLDPGKENIITTRLLLRSDEAGCLRLKDTTLPEMTKITGANIKILPREDVPRGISGRDEIVQIVGKIGAAREALVEVTSRVRSYTSQESLKKDLSLPSISSTSPMKRVVKPEVDSIKKITSLETDARNSPIISIEFSRINELQKRLSK